MLIHMFYLDENKINSHNSNFKIASRKSAIHDDNDYRRM